ncbi:hypothetical protein P3X46_030038 [Hevea brasiliensis]|uniref:Uncharacterized protein n=1 Tax=Hevea brasiliensis TaxID=3981 RepID=A0ABQ9KUY8_HEVBR|nr:hypothetical protein P3X46_030038 [Hevea brasiliensis]
MNQKALQTLLPARGPFNSSSCFLIKIMWNQVEWSSFDLTDVVPEQNASTHSEEKKQSSINTKLKQPKILSTAELISAVGQIWSLVNPLAISESEAKSYHNGSGSQESVSLGDLAREDGLAALKDDDARYLSVDAKTACNIKPSVHPKPEFLTVTQKLSVFQPCAFSGIFVSLCLHPVDTIKTVTQSCRREQKSICDIGRSIVSERGVTGLYRGIASHIASSAPISAIYTFTYESVKGTLLPLFSKEYHSVAHCVSGGCASIAASFVFTPSEHVKQQMQICLRYHNCCLKQLMLSSQNSHDQPNTLQTLVCGGLAGFTAALFTTPFDVVKTRLQIQIPGSLSQYDNVFHALKEIGKNEGLKGLYRGLIPRLVMYMSQGALFFASYEFFKGQFFFGSSTF